MNELVNKISSYNLFNYLLPGAIFVVFIEQFTSYKIHHNDMLINAFLIYFIGLVISRVGSLLIEPIFRKIISFAKYEDFIEASKQDSKIEILSEANNMYRTFISLFFLIAVFLSYQKFCSACHEYNEYILFIILLGLFIGTYIKQTLYITKRVNNHCSKEKEA